MAEDTAGFNTGTLGNTLSVADAGDSTAFQGVVIDGAGAIVYDDAHVKFGSLSMKETTFGSNTTTGTGFSWTTAGGLDTATDHYGRMYLYFTQTPPAALVFMQFPSVASRNVRFQLQPSTGFIAFVDSVGGAGTTTISISLNQWIRFEWHVIHSATVGQVEMKLFNDSDSATPTETITGTSNYNTGTSAGGVHIGSVGNTPDGEIYWVDNVVVNATSYPGPVLVGAADVLSMQAHVFGHGVW